MPAEAATKTKGPTVTEKIIEYLGTDEARDKSNVEVAKLFQCNDGTVARARQKFDAAKSAPVIIELSLDDLCFDYPTQQRSHNDEDTVAAYAEAMRAGAEFPPIDVVHTAEGEYIPWDGFQRAAAAADAGHTTIRARVTEGTSRDAIRLSCGANANHGLRRSLDTIRQSVLTLLDDPEWAVASVSWIAQTAGVSYKFASKVVEQWRVVTGMAKPDKVVGSNGVEKPARWTEAGVNGHAKPVTPLARVVSPPPESAYFGKTEDDEDEDSKTSYDGDTGEIEARVEIERLRGKAPTNGKAAPISNKETDLQRRVREAKEFAETVQIYDRLAPVCRERFVLDVAGYMRTIEIRKELKKLVQDSECELGGVGGIGAKLGPWLNWLAFFLRRPTPKGGDVHDSGWLGCVDCYDAKAKVHTGLKGKADCPTCKGNGYLIPGLQ